MLTCQLCLTVGAHETLLMPWLVPIGHTTFSQGLKITQVKGHVGIIQLRFRKEKKKKKRVLTYTFPRSQDPSCLPLNSFFVYRVSQCDSTDLFTACAPRSELVLIAGHAVVFTLVRDEGLGANRLFTAMTDEAALVPRRACIL